MKATKITTFFCNKRLISSSVDQQVLFKDSVSGPAVALIKANHVICLNCSTCTALRLACRSWKIALNLQDCAVYAALTHASTWVSSRTGDFCSETLRQWVCLARTAIRPWQSGAKQCSSAQTSPRLLPKSRQLAAGGWSLQDSSHSWWAWGKERNTVVKWHSGSGYLHSPHQLCRLPLWKLNQKLPGLGAAQCAPASHTRHALSAYTAL